ncbi:xanthine dehydrogenase YagR molybdenum-binding subunit [Spinactinospora alkalitolerans]|uniref:Xanthine dehydrogenase YagR molybdenum-binding subunit n=1 Tax=Spinactinospora alkalitolerans TaxID=687207 RepID=A0A852TTB5_9ACTN|nr:molybdopterin-dependent oxidoreductase [Spinactinospora alkalitolerans]NYE45354.1 xanthine dehydrogenase YagR molybdenum-binding subunit [Spinactinospora alkalitolerans]
MDITVNGVTTEVDADPDATAVELVREDLGLTGTKPACGVGVCGACTVLVDGRPSVSCLTPAAALEGRSVTTVEGLGGSHPVQRAFAAHDGLQCGYCTPGFVVEAAAFVDGWRAAHGDVAPDRATIADALAGHLCRCGAYQGIYAAVAAACAGEHDRDDDAAPPRAEAVEKVTGRARYSTDVRPDGLLEAVIVRSTEAHARVVEVDAGAVPHVDLLGTDRTVRYVGQPIIAVAAPTRAKALAAAEQVTVAYERLPAVLDARQARDPASPPVYATKEARRNARRSGETPPMPTRWRGNVRGPFTMGRRTATAVRRITEAARRGDERLVVGEFSTAVQAHTPLEPHACVARWDERGDLHLHVSTQAVNLIGESAAKRWGLPAERVHVVAEHVGGGFGAKGGLDVETVAAVELAKATGAPVRAVLSRSEELIDAGNRPGSRTELALLADESGDLAALSMDVYGDGGVSVDTPSALLAMLVYGKAPRRLRDFDAVTNLPPGKPFRGPGGPPMLWALEQAVDEMALRLDEDPIALRRRWDGNPKRRALYDRAAALPAWLDRSRPGEQTGRFRRGVGVAAANWFYLLEPGSEVELTVEDGTIVTRTAVQDIGNGIRSVLTDVVRGELGLPADRVRVEIGRNGTVYGPPSTGSRTTASLGPTARDAARRLRAALREHRGERGADGSGPVRLDGADGLRVVGRRRRDHRGYVTPFPLDGMALGRGFSGAVHVTEVEVDTRLGTVRPTRVWAGISAGHIYSDRLARGQCEGGVVQGLGYALYEQRHVDPATGVVLTDNLEDYRIPGIGDTPEITVHFHEEGWDHVTGGGVGLAEVATVGVAASVGNAVHNATGWRPRDLPVRPDRLREGIHQ